MNSSEPIPKVEISPIACLEEGWQLIRDSYWLFVGICAVGMLLGGAAPFGVLMGPMMAGIYMCLFAAMRGQPIVFSKLFEGFNYFLQSFLVALILTGVGMVFGFGGWFIMMMAFMIGAAIGEEFAVLAMIFGTVLFVILITVVSVAVGLLTMFAFQLVVDRNMNAWEAFTTSMTAVTRNLGGLLGLMLLNWLISLVGVLCCYVGVFFVMPICFAATTVAYRRVFPDLTCSDRDSITT